MNLELNRREFLKASIEGAAAVAMIDFAANNSLAAIAESPQGNAEWITTLIVDYVAKSPNNSIRNAENEKAWAEPLVGFARGDDPIFQFYKEDIGAFHWTPPGNI